MRSLLTFHNRLFFFATALLLAFSSAAAQDSAERSDDWWRDQVFYQVFVRSFYDSDGDGIGDLQGLISQLDYLNDGDPCTTDDLGITALWLLPIHPSPSYHGYDVIDYYDINPEYGTLADFEALVAAAEERGIAIVLDLVVNHTARENPWFVDSMAYPDGEYADWYVWADEDPGYRGPWNQTVWHRAGDRYYYGVFWAGMPDLNYANPDVTAEMYNIADYWLDMGAAGFRLDAVKYVVEQDRALENTPPTRQWLVDFRDHVKSIDETALVLGEVWDDTTLIAQYLDDGAMDLAFEFNMAQALVGASRFGISGTVNNTLENLLQFYDPGEYATFLANHDQDRFASQVADRRDPAKTLHAAKLGASLLLTLPGTPFIYYGDEIGMTGRRANGDEPVRTPMQWTDEPTHAGFTEDTPWYPVNGDTATVNIVDQTDAPDSLLSHYRRLIQARTNSPALLRGEMTRVEASERKVYAFLRHNDAQTVLVLINMDDEPVSDFTLSLVEGPLRDVESAADLLGAGDTSTPNVNDVGGFADYAPLLQLAAGQVALLILE